MRSILAILLLTLPASTAAADEQVLFQVRASAIELGDGSRIEDGVLLVESGKIRKVGRGVELDPAYPVLEHEGVLTPGIVVCHTRSGAGDEAFDETRALIPEARLADALDPGSLDLRDALRAGVTSMVLAPSGENVAGGITAVVKTNGSVLEREAHLALSLTGDALSQGQQGFFFFFGAALEERHGAAEDTEDSERGARHPTSYAGALRELGRRFEEAGGGSSGPFERAAAGELPLLVEAWERHEVVRAARLLESLGVPGAIRGAPLAGELVDALRSSGAAVILGPFASSQTRPSLESIARLSEAGIPVGFAMDGPTGAPEGVRLGAAMARTAGAAPETLKRALFSDAAGIAGVGERVGRLERGLDADFVLWSGDPLDLRSRVVAVYVDGELAYREERR